MGSITDPNLPPLMLSLVAASPMVWTARGARVVKTAQDVQGLNFTPKQCQHLPALLLPVYDLQGNVTTHLLRPVAPHVKQGVMVEYEIPPHTGVVLDVPPSIRGDVLDTTKPLVVTSGIFDADAAASHDLSAVAILGLEADGAAIDAALWGEIPLTGRPVYLAFASDIEYRIPGVTYAARHSLEKRGALVQFIQLPQGNLGERVGVASFFAKGGTTEGLLKLIVDVPSVPPVKIPAVYSLGPDGTIWHKEKENVILANFTAKIVREILLDDGLEKTRIFDLEVYLGAHRISVQIPAVEFSSMAWPAKHLGARAIIAPLYNALPHLRVAIQRASGDVPCHHVYRHTGWVQTDRHGLIYLHGKGAIGLRGEVTDIEVQLEGEMAAYELPPPPPLEVLRERVRTSLDITRHIAEHVSIPVLAATYRVVLGDVDASVFLVGPTGVGKSEMAALAQQHFGAKMSARHLPASWSSTPNSLEDLAFIAKDTLLVIDDFVTTSPQQAHRLHDAADRVLRAQGNRSGRQRLQKDARRQPARPPRGLILSTGEETPHGQSLNARFLLVVVAQGDVCWAELTDCQTRAARGECAEAMAGFIRWLIPRKDGLDLLGRRSKLRMEVAASHRRSADTAANIAIGWQVWLEYAVDIGALTPEEGEILWLRGWHVIRDVAEGQRALQEAQEPAYRFIELVRAAISGGRAHLTDPTGAPPTNPLGWGWRQFVYNASTTALQPQGSHIGWLDGQDLYLEPDNAFKVAQQMSLGGAPFTTTLLALKEALLEKKWLVECDRKNRDVYTVRRTVHGVRREVLYLDVTRFLAGIDATPHIFSGTTNDPTIPTNGHGVGMVGLVGSGDGEEQNISENPTSEDSSGLMLPPPGAASDDA